MAKYDKLEKETLRILKQINNNSDSNELSLAKYKKLQGEVLDYSSENSAVQNFRITDTERLKQLKKYATSLKRTAKRVPFALRRNKRNIYGDFTLSKYLNTMNALICYAKGSLKSSEKLLNIANKKAEKLGFDNQNIYFGANNTLKMGKNICPISTSRHIKGKLSQETKSLLDRISLCYPKFDKHAFYGTINCCYEKDGSFVNENIEFAFDNSCGFELIKNHLVSLLPDSTSFIKITEVSQTARKSNVKVDVYDTPNKIESLLKRARNISSSLLGTTFKNTRVAQPNQTIQENQIFQTPNKTNKTSATNKTNEINKRNSNPTGKIFKEIEKYNKKYKDEQTL